MSWLARRVLLGRSTAKFLADTDAVEKLTCYRHLVEEAPDKQTTELVLDLRSAFRICPTLKQKEKIKNKFVLVSIRKEFHAKYTTTI